MKGRKTENTVILVPEDDCEICIMNCRVQDRDWNCNTLPFRQEGVEEMVK